MNFESGSDLLAFAARFLELRGAVLDKLAETVEVLLPEDLARGLDVPEHVELCKETSNDPGRLPVAYGSPLLERILDAACGIAPMAVCVVDPGYIKREGFDRLIRSVFHFDKMKAEIVSVAQVRTAYLLLTCRYTAQSDDRKQGLFELAFHVDSAACISGLHKSLVGVERYFEEGTGAASLFVSEVPAFLIRSIERYSRDALETQLERFREGMNRRFRRDSANLEAYYQALGEEMKAGLARVNLSEALKKEREEKIAGIPEELERKRHDLFKKYSIRVKVEPGAAMGVRTPAVKVLCRLTRGRDKKNVSLVYNPLTKTMDPLVCGGCGKSITSVYSCDSMHVLCNECAVSCPLC